MNKIQLECYFYGNIEYEIRNNKIILTKPFEFIPFKLEFSKEEMHQILDILANPKLKITIEKWESDKYA